MLKCIAISDTHGFHRDFVEEDFRGIDMIFHGGDFANPRSPTINAEEAEDFLRWFAELPIKHKILIAGNHDTSVEAGLVNPRHYDNITYLEHEAVEVAGLKIFGSPYTKAFGQGWAYNLQPQRLDAYWSVIPPDTDVLITHGPPKGILDLALDEFRRIEFCGDTSLRNHVERAKPLYHIFGHIHDNGDNINKGMRKIPGQRTTYINASCVTDRRFDYGLTSRGIKFEL